MPSFLSEDETSACKLESDSTRTRPSELGRQFGRYARWDHRALRFPSHCPPPEVWLKTTIKDVRYYTTKPMNGGATFKCTFCEHRVTTLDFDIANGSRRTQAAAAINQHVASSHSRASRRTLWYPKS